MKTIVEDTVEQVCLDWFKALGYTVLNGPDIAPDGETPERNSYSDVILANRFLDSLARVNPNISDEVKQEVLRKVLTQTSSSLVQQNRTNHQLLIDGITIETQSQDGQIRFENFKLIDFDNPSNNDFLAVNQFTVVENNHNRRPDIVIFINGLPIGILELKNAIDDDATILNAFNQLQTYKRELPSLFAFNELLVVSDGIEAFVGSLTSDRERFMPWKTIDGKFPAPNEKLKLEILVLGIFEKLRLCSLIRTFIVFEEADDGTAIKKVAGYHQFHAVQKAVLETLRASSPKGDKRVGVVWHTQGSGKSLTMLFYVGTLARSSEMNNPTVLVLTDRNDLDDQLFSTFSKCRDLLRQSPHQAEDRDRLKSLLSVSSGGVVFTTIQKFFPEKKGTSFPVLSDRSNIVVVADEAHRSQYGFSAKADLKTGTLQVGYAQHLRDALPNASFVGFTGTPIEFSDKNTRAVFGDYISIYDIQQAVEDGATVPIYYESRLAKLQINESEKPHLDSEFEEVTEEEELSAKEKLKSKWAQLEAIVGSEARIKEIAKDLLDHFEKRQEALDGGKAMIVCMSRRICVELYSEIIRLRPQWHSEDDLKGKVKVIMTGSASDPEHFQKHIRSKKRREGLANKFRDPKDPFELVIVRDMWLTGFDAPCMHTLYVDKPMKGHGLMQAIARVNRVFRAKKGGLVVDYLGIADDLKSALSNYTQSGGRGKAALDQEEAVAVMIEKYEIACECFRGFDWSSWKSGTPTARLQLLPSAQNFILQSEESKNRFLKVAAELAQAFALSAPHEAALKIRDDVAFFQTVKTVLSKVTGMSGQTQEDLDHALRQLVSKAVSSDGVIDVFSAAGLQKPNISILSDEFLAEIVGMPQKNLAVELLARLLKDEVKIRSKKSLIQYRSFSEMLENAVRKYQARAIETAQIIEELIQMAKDIRAADQRGDNLGLSDDELAFYDALEVNDTAVKILGDEILKQIAKDLVATLKKNLTIDWTVRENVRANLRVTIKRLLRKHGYPPDKQEKATLTVLAQAEHLAKDWALEA